MTRTVITNLLTSCMPTGSLHAASIAHKIIMLHQAFLSKSFKDPRYTYTRWACAHAAKIILSLYTHRAPDEPQWWVEQAFVVTAGICLLLDMFHRPGPMDPEVQEYTACVQQGVRYLQQFPTSSVAVHGVRLLVSLLQEYEKLLEKPGTAGAKPGVPFGVSGSGQDMPILSQQVDGTNCMSMDPEVPLSSEEAAQFNFDIDTLAFEDLMDYLPTEAGLDGNLFFDSVYGIANGAM